MNVKIMGEKVKDCFMACMSVLHDGKMPDFASKHSWDDGSSGNTLSLFCVKLIVSFASGNEISSQCRPSVFLSLWEWHVLCSIIRSPFDYWKAYLQKRLVWEYLFDREPYMQSFHSLTPFHGFNCLCLHVFYPQITSHLFYFIGMSRKMGKLCYQHLHLPLHLRHIQFYYHPNKMHPSTSHLDAPTQSALKIVLEGTYEP